jgi:putative transcriptional regulator
MTSMPHLSPGHLLVATPELEDPNFARSVVLLLAHGDEGSLGVVVNRPGELPVTEVLPGLAPAVSEPATMFAGGPVQPDGVIGLGRAEGEVSSINLVIPGLGVVDLDQDSEVLAGELSDLRLFAGHAGWTPGQLEAELEQGGWFIVEARSGDVFCSLPDQLWTRVLRRQGGLFTTATVDPSSN